MTIAQPNRSNKFPAEITALRLKLRKNGFEPLPFFGKESIIPFWPRTREESLRLGWKYDDDIEIRSWAETHYRSINTGIDAKFTPGLNIDIMDDAAAEAVEALAREFFGNIHVCFGWPPARLILLRTDEPFPTLSRRLIAPDDDEQIIEILGDGQQYPVDGDTDGVICDPRQLYRWSNGDLGAIKHEDLPPVRREIAERFLDAATKLLIEKFNFVQKTAEVELEWLRRHVARARAEIAAYRAANPDPPAHILRQIRDAIISHKEINPGINFTVDDI